MNSKFVLSANILKDAEFVAVLTGAGVSAESGVPTFRGKDGLWKNFRAEDLASPEAFKKDPKLVWEWYNWRRGIISKAKPNPAHMALVELEKIFKDFYLITQNVDGLHFKAGNKKVVELHGNLWRLKCINKNCYRFDNPIYNYEVPLKKIPPTCECGYLMRPDVVWFGESLPPDAINKAYEIAENCEVMLVVGTSAVVQPAASLPLIVAQNGGKVIEINLEPTYLSSVVNLSILGKAGEILPRILDLLM
jgi:NAD-dependent deacetylase